MEWEYKERKVTTTDCSNNSGTGMTMLRLPEESIYIKCIIETNSTEIMDFYKKKDQTGWWWKIVAVQKKGKRSWLT
jgi:hypothetical protein